MGRTQCEGTERSAEHTQREGTGSLAERTRRESGKGRSGFSGWRLLGLGFWQAWWMISMCTGIVLPTTEHYPTAGNTTLWVLALTTAGYVGVVTLSRRLSPFLIRRPCLALAGGLTAAGTALLPASLSACSGAAGFACFLAAAIAASAGNALLLIMWGELWSALATGRVGRHLYVSYTFAFVLFFIASALPSAAGAAFTAALPIVSAAVLAACKQEPRREPSVLPIDMRTVPTVRILCCIVVISMVYGLSQGMVNTFASDDGPFMFKTMLFAGLALAAITLSMAVAPSEAEPIALYRPVIPAMAAGLILLLLLPEPYRFLGAGLVIMGVYCLDMLMMLVSTDVAFRGRIPVALSFGLVILCARTGTLVGSIGADGLLNSALWSDETRSAALLVGVLALVLVGMLFLTQTDVQKLYATPHAEPIDASLEEKCGRIAQMCRLTNREAEVLVLLARGRTVRAICDKLSIAQGTAKHHVSSIYRKVGVFDRQGLLDTIEQGGVGKPGWE
ncbi:helix-turn-helix transcriptional regulator [Gordonibacter sp. An230]|uniref:helix-turn-helix domain-containing protein n=1 Tax=Gordonibacter sp. An230 TaxID=1965592 RepID=UPI000B389A4C|nr:LuxR C-terminal-related transcriptional regulator [Gordonibacter sp. An230]OUO89860.1 helix-turn-helix transcriptional regulator [Gordonibacter sp. An230]